MKVMLNIYSSKETKPAKNEMETKVESSADYRRYVDPSGDLQTKDFVKAFWIAKHRIFFYQFIKIGLILFNAAIWGYSLVAWTIYFDGYNAALALERRKDNIDYSIMRPRYTAAPIETVSTELFRGGVGKYDAVAVLTNPNAKFSVQFDYYFILGGTSTPKMHGFLLPGEQGTIAYLGIPEEYTGTGSISLQLEKIGWHRISGHTIPDSIGWQSNRLQFEISDFTYESAYNATGLKVNRIKFNLTNNSPFSYDHPKFYVNLYSGGDLVGVMPLEFDAFNSLEQKTVDLRNFVDNLQVDSVEVRPLMNPYNQDSYIQQPGL